MTSLFLAIWLCSGGIQASPDFEVLDSGLVVQGNKYFYTEPKVWAISDGQFYAGPYVVTNLLLNRPAIVSTQALDSYEKLRQNYVKHLEKTQKLLNSINLK